MQSEMFIERRPQRERGKPRAGYRLPISKHAGILTHFQTKVKKKGKRVGFGKELGKNIMVNLQ